jgi:hypothetical protein
MENQLNSLIVSDIRSRNDDLSAARGIFLGCALGLCAWIAVVSLVWRAI